MSLIKEKIRVLLNKARNYNEFKSVVEGVLNNLLKSSKALDGLLLEVSSSKTLIRVLAASKKGGVETVEVIRKPGKKMAEYTPPPLAVIEKNWAALDDMYYYIELLEDAIVPELINTHKKASTKLVDRATAEIKIGRAKIAKALKVIQGLGSKHIPKELKKVSDFVEVELKKRFAKRFDEKNFKANIYVAPTELNDKGKGNLGYFYYMNFPGLKGDERSFQEFYIVIIGIVKPDGIIELKVSTLGKFMLPNVIPVETLRKMSDPVKILTEIEEQLFLLFNINVLKQLALPSGLDTKSLKKATLLNKPSISRLIESKSVKDEKLIIKLIPGVTAPELNLVISKIYPIIKGLFGVLDKDKRVINKEQTRSGKSYVLTFGLQPNLSLKGGSQGVAIDYTRIKDLQVELDLKDEDIDEMLRIIKKSKRKVARLTK